jgi:hypothetical protein
VVEVVAGSLIEPVELVHSLEVVAVVVVAVRLQQIEQQFVVLLV